MENNERIEIDARIMAAINQRNAAMDSLVVLTGQLEVLKSELQAAQEKIEKLEAPDKSSKDIKKPIGVK